MDVDFSWLIFRLVNIRVEVRATGETSKFDSCQIN